MFRKKKKEPKPVTLENVRINDAGVIDLPYLVLTLILMSIGLIMLFSASFPSAYKENGNSAKYFLSQAAFAAGGIVFMFLFSRIPYAWYEKVSVLIYAGAVVLLLAVAFFGLVGGGAKRWLNLGLFSFQPSEVAKVALIISLADLMTQNKDYIKSGRTFLSCIGALGIVALLLILEPHFSATVIVCLISFVMMALAGINWKFLTPISLLGAGGILFLLLNGKYTSDRIDAWKDPFADAGGKGYQIVQSLYSIGSGGWLGLGFGMSRQKYDYLPEEHNDYIFSIICEELGLVGAIVIMALFAMLIFRGFWIAMHCKDRFGTLLGCGLTTLLAVQVLLNIAVVTNSIPSTGISMPFFSSGGTALVMQLIEAGIMLNISRSIRSPG